MALNWSVEPLIPSTETKESTKLIPVRVGFLVTGVHGDPSNLYSVTISLVGDVAVLLVEAFNPAEMLTYWEISITGEYHTEPLIFEPTATNFSLET